MNPLVDDTSPLGYFETYRQQATNVERRGNIEIITNEEDGHKLGICHLVHMVPLSWESDGERKLFLPRQNHEQVAAVYLAIHHLNTGNGTIVKDVDGLDQRCNLRFTTEVLDSEYSEGATVKGIIDIFARTPNQGRLPCAFLGASRSAISMPAAIMTGSKGYPQMSAVSTSPALNDPEAYKLFGRTVPPDDKTSIPAIQYLLKRLNASHLGIVYANDAYGREFARALQSTASEVAPTMKIVPVSIPAIAATQQDYEVTVKILASTQYKYIFAIVFGEQVYSDLMTEAYKQGIAGPGYTWIFADALSSDIITSQKFPVGSPLHIATKGISILKAEGGIPGLPGYDKFATAMQSLNNEQDIAYMDNQVPHYNNYPTQDISSIGYFLNPPTLWSAYSLFIYDATIALGLSACNLSMATMHTNNNDESKIAWEGRGDEHICTILDSIPFDGASGKVVLEQTTRSRDPNSALYQLTNIVEVESESGMVQFQDIPSERFQNGTWHVVTPYVFSDGTTVPHPDLPFSKTDYLYFGTQLRYGCLTLSGIAIIMAIVFSMWTFCHRYGKVVQVSQSLILYIICFGNFLMASAIIPFSFDDEIISTKGCSITCMTAAWSFWIGFAIAFSGVFSKTTRLRRSFSMPRNHRRLSVTSTEVAKHMMGLVTTNIILLTSWTIVAPLKWKRTAQQFDGFGRPTVSTGFCTSEHTFIFQALLVVVNVGSLLISLYQVYRAQGVTNDFFETKYITAAVAGMLLVSLMGVPLMIIASSNPRALFFVMSCIIFVICTLFLLFLFVPKIKFHRLLVAGKLEETLASMGVHKKSMVARPTILADLEYGEMAILEMRRRASLAQSIHQSIHRNGEAPPTDMPWKMSLTDTPVRIRDLELDSSDSSDGSDLTEEPLPNGPEDGGNEIQRCSIDQETLQTDSSENVVHEVDVSPMPPIVISDGSEYMENLQNGSPEQAIPKTSKLSIDPHHQHKLFE